MPRARNIKPAFFTNEQLVELDFVARLLFIGLWTEADRQGRLEDRPKRLKMALFPADSVDIDAQLQSLHDAGLILRYEHDGTRLIQVVNFSKHQNPHSKETESVLPAPVSQDDDIGKESESPVQAPCSPSANPVPAVLIADSLSLDSLIPDSPSTDSQPQAAKSGKPTRNTPSKQNDLAELLNLGVDQQHAADWLTVRKAKGAKTLTKTAIDSLITESAKAGLTVAKAVEISAANEWRGFRADWLENTSGANHANNQKPRKLTGFDAVYAANAEAAYGNDFTDFDDAIEIQCSRVW